LTWSCNFTPLAIRVNYYANFRGYYNFLEEPFCHKCSSPGVEKKDCRLKGWVYGFNRVYALGKYVSYGRDPTDLLSEHIRYLKYFNKEEKKVIFKLILDENIWINLGYSYLNANRMEKALQSFLRARNINPINLKTLFIIIQIYVRIKDYDRASKIANEILQYYPENLKTIIGKDCKPQHIKKFENMYFI